MIISHKYKFVFIKTRKTAGTSIEVDLNKIISDEDVSTPIYPKVYGHRERNYTYYRGNNLHKLYNHMPVTEVRDFLGKDRFRDYFVFCVEREPVDKTVSYYSMLRNSPEHNQNTRNLSFDEYLSSGELPVDTNKYTDVAGNLLVDKILKYENLSEELKAVGKMLGFDMTLATRAKSGFRENISVSAQQREYIYRAFAVSNSYTGYKL